MILGVDSRKRWSKLDIVLAEAYQILENERCGQCGLPKYICQNASNDIDFHIEEEECHAIAAKEKHEKRKAGRNKKSEPKPGVAVTYSPYTLSGKPLTSYRGEYYEDRAKKDAALEAEREARRPKLVD